MARTYKRDASGRFAGGGGGSGGGGKGGGKKGASAKATSPQAKGAATKKAIRETMAKRKALGETGAGSRLKANLPGGKSAQKNYGSREVKGLNAKARSTITTNPKKRAANAKARAVAEQRRKSKAGMKGPGMKKAPVSAAKAEYKKLRADKRKKGWMTASNYDGAFKGRGLASAAGAATRKLNTFTKNRGVSKPAKRKKK